MKKRVFNINLAIFAIFSLAYSNLLAVQIEPVLRIFRQPDGREFQGRIFGDEFVVFYETADGYSIAKDERGFWCYAQIGVDGNLEASANRVGDMGPKLIGIQKHLRPSAIFMKPIQQKRKIFYEKLQQLQPFQVQNIKKGRPFTPESLQPTFYRLAVILIEFPDVPKTYSAQNFSELLFSENFTYSSPAAGEDSYGSLNDYYQAMSNGALKIEGQVFNWVTADSNKQYYYKNGNLSFEAVAKSGVDLQSFDGYTVIYAGTVAPSKSNLWPQTLTAGGKLHYFMSEKWLPKYDFSPIAVHAHEFGHLLGLPDLYDPDFSSVGVGKWGVMGSGNFGGGHHERPYQMSAWSKLTLGWLDVQTIYDGENSGLSLPPVESSHKSLKLISFASFFLLENRQSLGYDLYLPGTGLLIWHIDERFGSQSVDEHRLVDLEEADGTETGGDAGDPFPGKNNNTAFGPATSPSSDDYNGQSYIHISNITVSGENVYLDIAIHLGTGIEITVNGEGNFPNLFTAMEAASPGGEVFVPRGYYNESKLLLKRGVMLRGEETASTIIDGEAKRIIEVRNVAAGEISHLTFTNGATALSVLNSNIVIKYNIIYNMNVNGIVCFKTTSHIQNNTIVNVASSGITCLSASEPDIRNNILAYNGVGISQVAGAQPVLAYNDIWNNSVNYQLTEPGTTDLSLDPKFVNPFYGNYHLKSDSPCINAGDPDENLTDPDGTRNDIGAMPFEFSTASLGKGIQFNAGGDAYVTADSTRWLHDQPYIAGSWGFIGGSSVSTTDPIDHTVDDALYQTLRRGLSAYLIDIPNGRYLVRFLFAEFTATGPGERIFSVSIEGTIVLANYDIYAKVGPDYATTEQFLTNVKDGQLTIEFIPGIDEPQISAIEVLPVNPLFIDVSKFAKVADPGFGAGVALADYNNDGALDIFVANAFKSVSLFKNNGLGVFINETRRAGLNLREGSESAVWGDYDNDGFLDIYLVRKSKPNLLYRNFGNGTFTNVASIAGVANQGNGVSAGWGDFDRDGLLDLYVANAGFDLLYHNNGDGTFSEVTKKAKLQDATPSTGVTWTDFNNDGYVDLLVTHLDNSFSTANMLYYNNKDGTFSGIPLGKNGIGSTAGDYDNDGDQDVFMISLLSPLGSGENILYRNNGNRSFTNVTAEAGINISEVGFGANWGDFDHDGSLDLYILKGIASEQVYHNNGDGTFSDISDSAGVEGDVSAKTMASGDFDNDGDLDIYVLKKGKPNILYQNQDGDDHNWLVVQTKGKMSNAAGIGARIRVVAGNLVQTREVNGGSGFHSQNSLPVEFGLGEHKIVDTLQIFWPSGVLDTFTNIADINRIFTVKEGKIVAANFVTLQADVEEDRVTLKWRTANNAHFNSFKIERKRDDENSFKVIGSIQKERSASWGHYYLWVDSGLQIGSYLYRLALVHANGVLHFSDPLRVTIFPPNSYQISQNYPNPFQINSQGNSHTSFRFSLPEPGKINFYIYNVLGQEVFSVKNLKKNAGFHSIQWDGRDKFAVPVSAGLYFYVFQAGEFVSRKKMIIIHNKPEGY